MPSSRALLTLALLCAAGAAVGQSFEWPEAMPRNQGLSLGKLDRLAESLAARNTKAFLVVRNGAIVYEWYREGHGAARTHYTASMAKALVGGLSLGIALTDRRVALDQAVAELVPEWRHDPRKSRITLRHLGSHTSGLEDAEADDLPHDKLTGWKGDFWKRLDVPNDPFTISRDRTPALFEPGEKFQYSNPGIAMLTYALTASLKDAPHRDARKLIRERVMRPIGVPDEQWSMGYGRTFTVDGLPLVAAWGGGGYTARAVASVGRLLLREGDWQGKRLLSREAVRLITRDAGTPGHGGIGFWSNDSGRYAKLPRDAFWGSGAGHQVLLVVPSLNLIAVRNGENLATGGDHHDALNAHLFEPLLEALTETRSAPYPPSRLITRIDWEEPAAIVRRAEGSDNWPLTWGDDGHLYGAYGDGNGFDPKTPEKLSLGLVRIEGGPADFKGFNVRSATLEQKGDGKSGKKASGLLMVDGVLYLWVRNAGNAQLAWSDDHGNTWSWSDWKLTAGFGCPTFLNFGRNYEGAHDQYVYVYSHDSDSAYEPADRMVMARVPKDRIRSRDAYEFFKGYARDAPFARLWTRDIAERSGVFHSANRCYRSGISYDAGIKRYLWCQVLPGVDPRFAGGLGIYDAPQPFGPWTTVFYAETWDVAPGETCSFPTKWMSADGRTLHLVFSGQDAFSVRKATLTLSDRR